MGVGGGAVAVWAHKVFPGAKKGSLVNVWVTLTYADGTKTGGSKRGGAFEASEPLLGSPNGRAILALYLKSKKGAAMQAYVTEAAKASLGL